MGILTGGYLKMYTKKLQLQLQRQLTSVMLRYNKVQKQVGEMEKRLTNMQQSQNQVLNSEMQAANAGLYTSVFQGLQGAQAANGNTTIDTTQAAAIQQANMLYQQGQQYNSVFFTMKKFNMDESFEQFRTMQLEPLQNLEERLAMEKANLETRLATIKEQNEAAKEMEKDSRKDAIPDYTGQG